MEKRMFHVHTYRCGHAENVPDEDYVKRAIELGASQLWFTDHGPFPAPGDRLAMIRMKYSQLEEYIESIERLREAYKGEISLHCGLELEYLPTFDEMGYYKKLQEDPRLEILLLGQHFAEEKENPGNYSFQWSKERLRREEYKALADAICQGIRSGYFGAVAHPDRIYRFCREWTVKMQETAEKILRTAAECNVPVEKNVSSTKVPGQFWKKFWQLDLPKRCIVGLDAHKTADLKLMTEKEFDREYLHFF